MTNTISVETWADDCDDNGPQLYFGAPWADPMPEHMELTETPVGQRCQACRERITESTQGLLMGSPFPGLPARPIDLKCLKGLIGVDDHPGDEASA